LLLFCAANEWSRKQQSNMAEAKASDEYISADVAFTVGSSVGSVVSGLVDNGMLYGGQTMAFVSKAVALQGLRRLAARKTLLNTPSDTRESGAVAVSPLILKMLHACEITAKGKVWVVCAPSDQGKSAASEFIMHGEHSLRPDRSLKIDATDWKDFRADCAEGVLYCPQLASSLSGHLCLALASRAPADVDDSVSLGKSATGSIFSPAWPWTRSSLMDSVEQRSACGWGHTQVVSDSHH
jgi:hypothetical protein